MVGPLTVAQQGALNSLVREATIGLGLGLVAGAIWRAMVDMPTRAMFKQFYK